MEAPLATQPPVSIPVLDVDPTAEPAVAALQAEPERLALLLAQARRSYTPAAQRLQPGPPRRDGEAARAARAGPLIGSKRRSCSPIRALR
jgi:hypothetical protein